MLHTAGEAESTAGHGDRRTGAGRPRYMALDWENRHVRVRLERPLHQVWVKLRESGGFQDDSSFSSGAPGRCRPGPGLGAGYGTGSSFSYITAVLGSIRNTQCACATRWIVPLILVIIIIIIIMNNYNNYAGISVRWIYSWIIVKSG